MTEHTDPRKKRTRRLLRDALIELMQDRSTNEISVRDITTQAGVSRGTFYLHYQDKQDFLAQTMTEAITDLLNMTNRQERFAHKESYAYYREYFRYIGENADFFKVMLGEKGVPSFRHEFIAQGIRNFLTLCGDYPGENADLPSAAFLSSYVINAHVGVVTAWLDEGMKYSPDFMAAQLSWLTLHGPLRAVGLEEKVVLPR